MSYDCSHKGHHVHEADGSVYIRHSGRPMGETVDVHCCQCGTSLGPVPVYGKNKAPALIPAPTNCGDFV